MFECKNSYKTGIQAGKLRSAGEKKRKKKTDSKKRAAPKVRVPSLKTIAIKKTRNKLVSPLHNHINNLSTYLS